MQPVALAAIAICALVIALVSWLLYKRIVRLMDGVQETLASVNRVALGLERVVADVEKEIATIRGVTDRLTRVSQRVEALTHDAADTIETVLHPVKRISKAIGGLKAAIVGAVAGAAALQRRRGSSDETHEEPTPDRLRVGERSAP